MSGPPWSGGAPGQRGSPPSPAPSPAQRGPRASFKGRSFCFTRPLMPCRDAEKKKRGRSD
eukprot:2744842-Lingulodinium_polyedra.AAC.1